MPKVSDQALALRRHEILDGARQCFSEFGYEGATVSRLETATGKSRGAIFHHFGSKEGLFLALAEDDAASMAEIAESSGLVEVMRDIVAHPDKHEWLGTRLEIARKLRSDAEFRFKWLEHQDRLDEAVQQRLLQTSSSGSLRGDYSVRTMQLFLELILDGIIVRLASGRSVEELDIVLDLVEDSVRRNTK
ncbi:TetR/AcrR family transcriptional regulator [Corynebacterium lactis]|uniref:TetR family transcriptional regulator n=1 Tax=Corynebacterium lactis RW2-5 TaxID=1408189 RepID=A0A0K2H048_9CORY|nr:TetR/AcrR family transcriptional regulator [Corynebacterium lactis]ALA67404.1 TetR family transcriptional regulator [Corynebacterium lactis RW2-5]